MKYLMLFESFLEGGYEPLYRYTPKFFEDEMIHDRMIRRIPCDEKSRERHEDGYKAKSCICLTRSPEYSEYRCVRLKFDQNKLRIDGYKPKPIDEVGGNIPNRKLGYKLARKFTISPTVLKKIDGCWLSWEFEERIYSDINKLGKYIMSIQVPDGKEYMFDDNSELKKYLEKYPHIKLEIYDLDQRRKTKEITPK